MPRLCYGSAKQKNLFCSHLNRKVQFSVYQRETYFLSEVVRCGTSQIKSLWDSTFSTDQSDCFGMCRRLRLITRNLKLLEEGLLRSTMSSVDVDIYLVCSPLEVSTIVEDTYWNRLVFVVYLTDCRCHHLLALEIEENHILW